MFFQSCYNWVHWRWKVHVDLYIKHQVQFVGYINLLLSICLVLVEVWSLEQVGKGTMWYIYIVKGVLTPVRGLNSDNYPGWLKNKKTGLLHKYKTGTKTHKTKIVR